MSELVWIAVPSGVIAGGKAVVQVVVVPRLEADGFPALGNWAARILAPDFAPEVLVNGQVVPHEVASTARGDIWEQFFPATTAVEAWQVPPPRRAEEFVVRPSGAEAADLLTAYTTSAADIDNPAHVGDVVTQFGASRKADPRGVARAAPVPRARPVIADRPPADFHEIVAGLRDHPVVLRALGLIFDLVIDGPTEGRGRVSVTWAGAPVAVTSPFTAYVVEGEHFLPAPPVRGGQDGSSPQIIDAVVDGTALPPPGAEPHPHDGAGLKIVDGVVDLRPTAGWRLTTFDIDHGVAALDAAHTHGAGGVMPAMRSSGISLLHTERSAALRDQAGRSQRRLVDLGDEELDAHDLILGYRVDARIEGGTWFPLGARRATHTVNTFDIVREVPDDAHLKPHVLVREGDRLSTDEVVAHWSGWGLGCLRPHERGTVVDMPSDDQPSREDRRQPGGPGQDFDHQWEYVEPEGPSQLPLRFGQKYEMRIRIADLAGGGLGVDGPINSYGTDPLPYLRLEPVAPPSPVTPDGLLLPRLLQPDQHDYRQEVLGPGGTLTTLVVRSDRDQTASAFAAEYPTYPDNTSRLLTPPDTTLAMAEQHGCLDGPIHEAERVFRRALGLDGDPPVPDPMSQGIAFKISGTDEGSSVRWPGLWPDLSDVRIVLEALDPGVREAAAVDHASAIVVSLPQGEAVDLEIRSLIQYSDNIVFQLNSWLTASGPLLAEHSLAVPATTLRLVHATRRPLRSPGPFVVDRVADSPIARLVPNDAWFGLHLPSTAQLVASATWDDWGDDDKAVAEGVRATLPPLTIPVDGSGPAELVHDFRDTRRRWVNYRLEAVSRYREYFDPADPAEAFAVAMDFLPEVVPNSGKPPPIEVLNVVPAFKWDGPTSLPADGELTLVRRGGRLRVELGHPWYATGVGEQLGVLMNIPDAPDNQAGVLTELARDPIWRTNTPNFELGHFAAPKMVDHPESLADVHVHGFSVFLIDGRWYADVVLPVATYAPLVRLALARYQPESIPGRHLSTLTYTDWVPLLPDRTLVVNRQAGHLTVTLSGDDPGPDHEPLITVAVEQRPAGSEYEFTSVEANEPSAWSRVTAMFGRLNQAIALDLPAGGDQALRLVVMEAERHGGPAPTGDLAPTLTNRTTYLAHVVLTA